jgi:hypothetical protein
VSYFFFWVMAALVAVGVLMGVHRSLSEKTVSDRFACLLADVAGGAGYWWIFSLAWKSLR